ncbi:MAG: glycosyltransferase family 2 protein [Ferruginibacter sp.]|nr:glycosyltransferase family 2 protein [Chitinophagaceae bacterium]
MQTLSVVIVCKNEADIIGNTLQSLDGLTDDIIVYDNGSSDNTVEIVKEFNVQLHQGSWEGFGKTKNKATTLAKYNWILSLDADEAIDTVLKQSLSALSLTDEKSVYEIKYKNFLGNKYLKYGEWGNDKHTRLFNRTTVQWNDAPVHEELVIPAGTVTKKLTGFILHRTMRDIKDYATKMVNYALLNAEKYHRQGKQASWLKIRVAPGFAFLNHYILRGGFLDGYAGYVCAKMTAHYTFLKYARLKELKNNEQMNNEQGTPK